MRQGILYIFAALALVLIVSVAWWTRESIDRNTRVYTVQPGDTEETIAEDHNVSRAQLATANDADVGEMELQPGATIILPVISPTAPEVWITHLVGIGGEMLGVFMSLWLALVAGLLPKHIRRQVLGISVVLGIVSYATTRAVLPDAVLLTPAFLFAAIKDGFAWAAAFPLLARALGIREEPRPAASPAAPSSTPPPDAPELLEPPEGVEEG
jgi:hypothetical protein